MSLSLWYYSDNIMTLCSQFQKTKVLAQPRDCQRFESRCFSCTLTPRGCARDPSDVISQRLKEMFDVYSQHYEDSGAETKVMEKGGNINPHQPAPRSLVLPVCVNKVSPDRVGSEVLPPGGGALLQDPGVHHRAREDDPGRR